MHPRIKVRNETPRERMARWKRQPAGPLTLDVVLSHLIKWFKLYTSTRKWILYLTVFKFFYYFMKIFNREETINARYIPKSGALIYANHISSLDAFVLFPAMPRPFCGGFIAWGNGFFSDMIERFYGLQAFRYEDSREMNVEKMVRSF